MRELLVLGLTKVMLGVFDQYESYCKKISKLVVVTYWVCFVSILAMVATVMLCDYVLGRKFESSPARVGLLMTSFALICFICLVHLWNFCIRRDKLVPDAEPSVLTSMAITLLQDSKVVLRETKLLQEEVKRMLQGSQLGVDSGLAGPRRHSLPATLPGAPSEQVRVLHSEFLGFTSDAEGEKGPFAGAPAGGPSSQFMSSDAEGFEDSRRQLC